MNSLEILQQYYDYLVQQGYHKKTLDNLCRWAKRFLQWLLQENIKAKDCKYSDLLGYIKMLNDLQHSAISINRHLWGVQRYYIFLMDRDITDYNPAMNLRIKGITDKLPSNILSKDTLQHIYESYQPETPVQLRNKVILSLMVFQGLMRRELDFIDIVDINLHQGTVLIKKSVALQRRSLKLEACQVLLLQEYITKVRPVLLQQRPEFTDRLLFTIGPTSTVKEAVRNLLHYLQLTFPELLSFQQVRTSVIAHWTKEMNIRLVQYMAGHASIKSTQKYRMVNLDDLQEQLKKYHSLE